ncbi:hypothetical protein PTKIN_Ptkin07bG0038600 [Pterospermum kingtungense]
MKSSHGLLLCLAIPLKEAANYCVCNPLTKKSVALPPAPSTYAHYKQTDQYLIFANNVQDDVVTGYKVVRLIISCEKTAILELEIFSSETSEWTTTKVNCPRGLLLGEARFNPIALNWILYVPDETNNALIRYDLDSNADEWQCLPLPMLHKTKQSSKHSRTSYGVCKGDLRCIYKNGTKLQKICVWNCGY